MAVRGFTTQAWNGRQESRCHDPSTIQDKAVKVIYPARVRDVKRCEEM